MCSFKGYDYLLYQRVVSRSIMLEEALPPTFLLELLIQHLQDDSWLYRPQGIIND
jgi:hypothetical protein